MSLYTSKVETIAIVNQYCSLFDSNPNGILVLNPMQELVYYNQSFTNQFGESLEALIDLLEDKQAWETNTQSVMESSDDIVIIDPKTNIEFRSLRLNGMVYCMVSIPTNSTIRFQRFFKAKNGNAINVADQKLFDSILENSPQAVLILDYEKKKYVAVNDKASTLFGYDKDELIGMTLGDLSSKSSDSVSDGESVADQMLKGCVSSNKRKSFDWQIRQKDGTLLSCEISVFRIPTQNGTFIRSSVIDVSHRNKITEQIQESSLSFEENVNQAIKKQQEGQLKAFVRDSPIPVAMLDSNMNYLFVADEWIKQFPTKYKSDIIGRNHYELNPNLPLRWKLQHKQALKGNSSGMKRDQFVNSNGENAWCRWDVKPWYHNDDTIGGIIIYAQDITEDVLAESKLSEQERKYKHFFNSDSIGWVEVSAPKLIPTIKACNFNFEKLIANHKDCLGSVVRYNQKSADIFGLSLNGAPEDFEPLRFIKDGFEELTARFLDAIKNKLESFSVEVLIENTYREERSLNINIHFSDDNGKGDLLYAVQDITDLKQSVKALRDSEERYRTMFDSNSLAVVYTNYDKNIVKINEAFTRIFGYSEEDMQVIKENDMLLPSYREMNTQINDDFKAGVKRYVSLEKEYEVKSGKTIVAQTASSALYDDAGRHYGNVTIIEDITERKVAERQIRKQNEELIKINQELDQFVYSAAHDLRAPIANVMGLVKLMRLEEISETATHYLGLQEKSLAKLDEFIKSIVDYSRNSRLGLSKDEIDMNVFVNDVVDQYRYSEHAEKLDITININQKVKLITDENRLSVIMNNLVSNAVRYMDIEKPDCYLNIEVEVTKNNAKIKVSDNGIGIETEHLHAIFELFYRASSNSKGTGIGLYIVKETVEKLEGEIYVDSDYGKGTTFTVQVKNFLEN